MTALASGTDRVGKFCEFVHAPPTGAAGTVGAVNLAVRKKRRTQRFAGAW